MIHKKNEEKLINALHRHGIQTKLCNKKDYEEELIKWADVIFTAGGEDLMMRDLPGQACLSCAIHWFTTRVTSSCFEAVLRSGRVNYLQAFGHASAERRAFERGLVPATSEVTLERTTRKHQNRTALRGNAQARVSSMRPSRT